MEQHQEFDLIYCLRLLSRFKIVLLLLIIVTFVFTAYKESRKPILYEAAVSTLETGGVDKLSSLNYTTGRSVKVIDSGGSSSDLISAIIYSRRMAKDIKQKFGKSPVSIQTYSHRGVFRVRVTANDPKFAVNVANFCVDNVDKINDELDVSSTKPLLKVLDSAEDATPISRHIAKKIFFPVLIVSMMGCFLVIFIDVMKKHIR